MANNVDLAAAIETVRNAFYGRDVRQANQSGTAFCFDHSQGFEFVQHFFGPFVEVKVILRRQEIKNFNLDMTPAAPIQFLFLCRFDNSDEEIPVILCHLRSCVDE